MEFDLLDEIGKLVLEVHRDQRYFNTLKFLRIYIRLPDNRLTHIK